MTIVDPELFWSKASQYFMNERLELTVLPTEHCNFRCTYCYEDFALGRMSRETIDALKKFILHRAPELTELQIRWFGGEPLIAFDIIEEISTYITQLIPLYPQLQLQGSVTTNGWLLDIEHATRLAALHVNSFQITLDGPQIQHDSTRLLANNRGSYEGIHKNLRALKASNLPINIELRLHLTPDNLPVIEDYADFLATEYLVDPRFHLEPFPVGHLGGANDAEFAVLDFKEAVAAMHRIRQKITPAIVVPDDTTQSIHKDRYVCYAARGNAYVIRADGSLGKCTVALNDTRNYIGHLTSTGELSLLADTIKPWLAGWKDADWSVLQCPLDDLQAGQPWRNSTVIKRGLKP
jgi:uncharacterized protein